MTAHPHTLPAGPCPGARTFGITVRNCVRCGALLDNGDTMPDHTITARLEHLRGQLRAECISWGELHELQGLVEHIAPDDVELREAAGLPEHPSDV